MLVLLVLLVLLGSLVDLTNAVVGGTPVSIFDAPFAASLFIHAGSGSTAQDILQCSAALLNERWAITAFRCVQKGTNPGSPKNETVKFDAVKIRVGEADASKAPQYNTEWITSHPDFPEIALIKLTSNVSELANTSAFVTSGVPIASSPPQDGDFLSFAGFGAVARNGFGLTSLLSGYNGNFSVNATCQLTGINQSAADLYFCFGHTQPPVQSACAGDIGSVLVNAEGDAQAIFLHNSLDQPGLSVCNGDSIFFRIDGARDWINATIQNFTGSSSAASLAPPLFATLFASLLLLI